MMPSVATIPPAVPSDVGLTFTRATLRVAKSSALGELCQAACEAGSSDPTGTMPVGFNALIE